MAHNETPHQDLRCLQIQLFASLQVVKELSRHNCYLFFPFDVFVLYTYSVINGCLSCADISGIWCHLAQLERLDFGQVWPEWLPPHTTLI